MSAEVVNLRLARKRRERSAKEEEAARNRLLHGETKAARTHKRLTAEKARRDLDARKLEASRELSPIIDETL
ncbi:MAG TPA: DUF4169 family protein [Beijerinckiaceae bacterium]|nr:DUF4169 family protein [Beijerinckiaceae bacterium]